MNIEQFYRLSQLVRDEIQKQNINYRRAIASEERLAILLRYVLKKSAGDKKGILDIIIGATLFLNSLELELFFLILAHLVYKM